MAQQVGDVDINNIFKQKEGVTLSEGERLGFAKQVLFWIAVIIMGVFIAYGYLPENKAIGQIFELIKIGALPLVTLVISFYFPKANQ